MMMTKPTDTTITDMLVCSNAVIRKQETRSHRDWSDESHDRVERTLMMMMFN